MTNEFIKILADAGLITKTNLLESDYGYDDRYVRSLITQTSLANMSEQELIEYAIRKSGGTPTP